MSMQDEYLARNARGYEGDECIHREIGHLVATNNVELIIETGSFKGATARRLSEFCPVITIEKDARHHRETVQNCRGHDVVVINRDSADFLREYIPPKDRQILFFLDAHWNGTPLLEELRHIAAMGIRPVIVIHDFKVPGRPDLGYDSYVGQDYAWEWIEKRIEAIYGGSCGHHYNDEAEGARRGVVYIYPGARSRFSRT